MYSEINIADLDKRVTLQYKTKTANGTGGFVEVWVSGSTVWAKITTLRSTEAIISMQASGVTLHNVLIRYRSDVTALWRIKYTDKTGDKFWAIIGTPIDLGKKHEWLDIKCKEVA